MSLLQSANTNKVNEGVRMVIAGAEKMGKTTLTCGAPGALLIPCEIGYGGVNVAKTSMVTSFAEVMALLDDVATQCQAYQFGYKTLIFDSATALERFIHTSILEIDKDPKSTMESALGGYGKAYTFANQKFDEFLKKCDYLSVNFGINIVLTSHVFASEVLDPSVGKYSCWDLQLHSPKNNKTFGKREMLTQWADVIGYLHEPVIVTKKDDMSMGVSANKGRMLGMSRTPAYVAGNRYGVVGEIAIPKEDGWNAVASAIYSATGGENGGVNIYYYPS